MSMTGILTPEQREHVSRLRHERATLTTPAARLAFDNDERNGSFVLRLLASYPDCPTCNDAGCESCPGVG